MHIKYLADRKTGLWFHGWDFEGRHNFADALWARGNCWVTIAIPEFIELLDLRPGDALRQFLIDTLEAQVKALADQDEGGLWHTLIATRPRTGSLGHGRLRLRHPQGRAQGLSAREYQEMGIKAIKGVLANIDDGGRAAAGPSAPRWSTPPGLQGHPA